MAIGANHESAVIIRVIDGADARWTIVLATSGQCSRIKVAYLGPVAGLEGQVHGRMRLGAGAKPEIRLAILAIAYPAMHFRYQAHAQGAQSSGKKCFARLRIADVHTDMIENHDKYFAVSQEELQYAASL